jgi:hypothetical protein
LPIGRPARIGINSFAANFPKIEQLLICPNRLKSSRFNGKVDKWENEQW